MQRHRRGTRLGVAVVALVLVGLLAFGAFQGVQAGSAGNRGKAALERAEGHVASRDLDQASQELASAVGHFRRMGEEVGDLGRLLPLVKRVPLVGSQVVGVEALAEVGVDISEAGLELVHAAQEVLDGGGGAEIGSGLLEPLGTLREAVQVTSASLEPAAAQVSSLEDEWLLGPLGDAYETLATRLPELRDRLGGIDRGLGALATFVGGSGPRQYLFLSQNPDEVRPTGGFIGTYGVLTADGGELALPRYAPIGSWTRLHPEAVIPGEEAGSPFRFASPPVPQTLGNVNNTPDWPTAASLAAELWTQGGEEPVEGVVSFVPAFLARLLGVLGAVEVPEFNETVTRQNLVERFEFYTDLAEDDASASAERKDFVVTLSQVVMDRLLNAPASQWDDLAQAVGEGFERSEAMAWSTDEEVAAALAERGWDAAFPETEGDFFYNGEFSYAAKNGNGLERSFDHHVEVRGDGSGVVTTSMVIANTEEPGALNTGSLSYITLFGPQGAALAPGSDAPLSEEPTLAGHPAAGWLLSAPPLGQAGLRVVWEVPELLQRGADGAWRYSLLWKRLPGHTGDQLNLTFDLPPGWSWEGGAPPAEVGLERDFAGTWLLSAAG